MSGPIPLELGRLANLQSLGLNENELSGSIPPELGQLASLQVLGLSRNELSGSIPPELGQLAGLQGIVLANNQLSGSIPPELGDLTHMRALVLSDNELSGPIPAELGNLAGLQFVRFAGNPGLSGCVPRTLRHLLTLPTFSLAGPGHDFVEVDVNGDGDTDDALDGDVPGLGLPFCMLRDLQLGGATLDPPFAAGAPAYTASVDGSVAHTAVTATLIDGHAYVLVRKGGRTYASGEPVPLDPGVNALSIEVAPLDATPRQVFTVAVTRGAVVPITLELRDGSDLVIAPPGTATTAARLLDGTDVQVAWKYNRDTRAWDRSYLPAIGFGGFPIGAGDALWVIAGSDQTLTVEGARPPAGAQPPGPVTLAVREGSDLLVVPAGAPTTAAALFGGTDVQVVWKYDRASRAWDLSYLPGPGFGGFDIAPGDGLWVISPRAQTLGGAPAPAPVEPRIADPVAEVSTSETHTCALRESGEVLCWGANDQGQTDVPPERYRAVAAGSEHTCGLLESGEIVCWGSDRGGPLDVPDGTYIAVGAGYARTCALRESGEVACWGSYGSAHQDVPSGTYRSLSVGFTHACALGESGEVVCWGSSAFDQSDAPSGVYKSVSAGRSHTCALRESGQLVCWGLNTSGNRMPNLSGTYRSVSAGDGFTCGVRESGKVVCWGNNHRGVTEVPDGRYVSVSAGEHHACAVRESGAMDCWGGSEHDYGQADAPAGRYLSVSAGEWHSCAVTEMGEVECWGSGRWGMGQVQSPAGRGYGSVVAGNDHTCGILQSGEVRCWGSNASGQLDVPAGRYQSVRAGRGYTCALPESGDAVCWGSGAPTWRADPPEIYRGLRAGEQTCETLESGDVICPDGSAYVQHGAPEGPYVALTAGRWHRCALLESRAVACWLGGIESHGRPAVVTARPAAVPPELAAPLPTADAGDSGPGALVVDAGAEHTCALQASGEVLCWGAVGSRGELVPLPRGPYRSMSVGGDRYTCGVRTSGAVVCAGIHDASFNQAPG